MWQKRVWEPVAFWLQCLSDLVGGCTWHLICCSIFSHSPRAAPILLFFHVCSHVVFCFHHFGFHFPNASGNLCFFQDGGPFGRSPNPTLTAWKRNGKETKLRMLVQGGPALNLSPLMPWQFLLVFFWFIFVFVFPMFVCVFLSIPWVGPGLLFWFVSPFSFQFFLFVLFIELSTKGPS